jgi:2-polyprenyl-3-methyl-5-hydroxy-6-metoxy-1,4-benzoquinol methylase
VNLGLARRVPRGRRVLDVGCGSGLLGERYRAAGNVVWGIDSAAEVEPVASARLDRFLRADVTDPDAIDGLASERFDVLVFADVLEHVFDPVGLLRSYRRFLAPGGVVHISVPNVAIWNTRFGLLLGRFRYRQTGTLDKTHVRFFTRANLDRACAEAGLEVVARDITPGILRPLVPLLKRFLPPADQADRGSILNSRPYRVYLRFVYPLEHAVCALAPGLLAFQYIAEARAR